MVCNKERFRQCEICGIEFFLKPPYTATTHSKKWAIEKSKKTGSSSQGREKAKQTSLENHGVEHPMKSREVVYLEEKRMLLSGERSV